MKVIVYTKSPCPGCDGTKRSFHKLGIPYEERSILDNAEYVRDLGYLAAPVVEVDCGDGATVHWSGFRPTCIQELYATLADELIASG